ncbi:MAG TPA: DUF3618 domain-containing protein [Stellaceae bacterium]
MIRKYDETGPQAATTPDGGAVPAATPPTPAASAGAASGSVPPPLSVGVPAERDLDAARRERERLYEQRMAQEPALYDGSSKRPDEIENDIAHTRADLSETLDALERRLAPRHLFEVGVDMLRGTMNGNSGRITESLSRNPLPLALIGVGLGWLLLSNTRTGAHYSGRAQSSVSNALSGAADRIGSTAGNLANRAGGTAGSLVGRVADTAGSLAGRVGDTAGGLVDRVRGAVGDAYSTVSGGSHAYARSKSGEAAAGMTTAAHTAGDSDTTTYGARSSSSGGALQAAGDYAGRVADYGRSAAGQASDLASSAGGRVSSVGSRFGQVLEDYPLAVGALGFLAGAVIAASLPSTEIEDELVGETRDDLLDQAQSLGREAVDRVQQVATSAANAAADAAVDTVRTESQNQGLTPENLKSAAQDAAETVKGKAEDAAEAVKGKAEDAKNEAAASASGGAGRADAKKA